MAADHDDMAAEIGRRLRERELELRTHADSAHGPSRAREEALLGVLGLASPRPSRVVHWAVAAVVAATLVTFGLWRVVARSSSDAPAAAIARVGAYELELGGGRATHLGATAAHHYRVDDVLVVRVRPLARERGPRVMTVSARRVGDGREVRREAIARSDDGGAIELRTRAGDLLGPGRWRLEIGVGAPGGCEGEGGCTWVEGELEISAAP